MVLPSHRPALLAAARSALPHGPTEYERALRIYADWCEDDGGDPVEAERVRRLLPAVGWACERGIDLPGCELVEGTPWVVWREDGRDVETEIEEEAPTELERTEYPELLTTLRVTVIGFGCHANRQPCAGEYIGRIEVFARIGDIMAKREGHLVLSTRKRKLDAMKGWTVERMWAADLPSSFVGDGVQSFLLDSRTRSWHWVAAARAKGTPARAGKVGPGTELKNLLADHGYRSR